MLILAARCTSVSGVVRARFSIPSTTSEALSFGSLFLASFWRAFVVRSRAHRHSTDRTPVPLLAAEIYIKVYGIHNFFFICRPKVLLAEGVLPSGHLVVLRRSSESEFWTTFLFCWLGLQV